MIYLTYYRFADLFSFPEQEILQRCLILSACQHLLLGVPSVQENVGAIDLKLLVTMGLQLTFVCICRHIDFSKTF